MSSRGSANRGRGGRGTRGGGTSLRDDAGIKDYIKDLTTIEQNAYAMAASINTGGRGGHDGGNGSAGNDGNSGGDGGYDDHEWGESARAFIDDYNENKTAWAAMYRCGSNAPGLNDEAKAQALQLAADKATPEDFADAISNGCHLIVGLERYATEKPRDILISNALIYRPLAAEEHKDTLKGLPRVILRILFIQLCKDLWKSTRTAQALKP